MYARPSDAERRRFSHHMTRSMLIPARLDTSPPDLAGLAADMLGMCAATLGVWLVSTTSTPYPGLPRVQPAEPEKVRR